MEFGKETDLSRVSFTLPPDPVETGRYLRTLGPADRQALRLGYTAWTAKEWVGTLYPPQAKAADFLHHYARQFHTIELNTTFYRIPDAGSVARWRAAVPESFRFCPKVFQGISHRQGLFHSQAFTQQFARAIEGFGDRLGPCFLQLPPNFGPALLPRLEKYIEQEWPRTLPLAIEFRHEGWFDDSPIARSAFDFLQAHGVGAVITDVAGRRDVLHMRLTAPFLLLRLVGNQLHSTDFTRLDNWLERLNQWFQKGLKETYLFLHQPEPDHIATFATHFIRRQNESGLMKLPELTRYDELPPQEPTLF